MGILNVYKDEIKLLGLKQAVFISELRNQERKVLCDGGFYKDGFFIWDWKDVEKVTALSRQLQYKYLRELELSKFIECRVNLDEDTRTQIKILVKGENYHD